MSAKNDAYCLTCDRDTRQHHSPHFNPVCYIHAVKSLTDITSLDHKLHNRQSSSN